MAQPANDRFLIFILSIFEFLPLIDPIPSDREHKCAAPEPLAYKRDWADLFDKFIFGKFFSGCNFAADTLKSKRSFREIRFGCKHHAMDHLAIKAHRPPEGYSAEDEISLTIRADHRNQPEEMHAFVVRQHQLLPTFISCEHFQSQPL